MAKYLTCLWDEYSKLVLRNSNDLSANDPEYPSRVRAVVWQSVRELRKGRQAFREEIRQELKAKRRGPPSSRKPPPSGS
jgi:hypothetical protein